TIFFAYAVTPIHVGMGRAPGAVDLPFQRDSIGYPIIYGSSFKGVLKSTKALENNSNKELINCLFGAEPDDESKSMGRFIFTDLIPIFYPLASLDKGFIYATTEYLVSRANDILDLKEEDKKLKLEYKNEYENIKVSLRDSKAKGSINSDNNQLLNYIKKGLGNLLEQY
ncbi:MAG: type III-B CRISPR module RAMP protein Cmr4, partial [Thermoplasmata archaeon]